jgi:hypothetical protein
MDNLSLLQDFYLIKNEEYKKNQEVSSNDTLNHFKEIEKNNKMNSIKNNIKSSYNNLLHDNTLYYLFDRKYFLIDENIIKKLYNFFIIDSEKNSGLKLLIKAIKNKILNENDSVNILDNNLLDNINNFDDNKLEKINKLIDVSDNVSFDKKLINKIDNRQPYLDEMDTVSLKYIFKKEIFIKDIITITYKNEDEFIKKLKNILNNSKYKKFKEKICDKNEINNIKSTLFYYVIHGYTLEKQNK